jgi:DNA repair protein RadC
MDNSIKTQTPTPYSAASTIDEDALIANAVAILQRRLSNAQIKLTSSQTTIDFVTLTLAPLRNEAFHCLFLNNQHQLIASEQLFTGTIDGCTVYPREVVKKVLAHNAAAVIFAHNHPSGDAEPSSADMAITNKLKTALNTIDVRVLDHIVVGNTTHVSFAEKGLI